MTKVGPMPKDEGSNPDLLVGRKAAVFAYCHSLGFVPTICIFALLQAEKYLITNEGSLLNHKELKEFTRNTMKIFYPLRKLLKMVCTKRLKYRMILKSTSPSLLDLLFPGKIGDY